MPVPAMQPPRTASDIHLHYHGKQILDPVQQRSIGTHPPNAEQPDKTGVSASVTALLPVHSCANLKDAAAVVRAGGHCMPRWVRTFSRRCLSLQKNQLSGIITSDLISLKALK
jgi:hypothetical protein